MEDVRFVCTAVSETIKEIGRGEKSESPAMVGREKKPKQGKIGNLINHAAVLKR